MTIFGFAIWESAEQKRIREAQGRIAASFEGLAEDIEQVCVLNRERMGLPEPQAGRALAGRTRNNR